MLTQYEGDYSSWLRANCPEVEFIDAPEGEDWRDAAVNAALDESTAEHVWFTEQDFFITDEKFWEAEGSVVGFNANDGRFLHPASIFADRDLIDRTARYFGPSPVDHFFSFGVELCRMVTPTILTEGFVHLQGTTQNHFLIGRGEDAGVFKRERFRDYLRDCLSANIPLHCDWVVGAERELA
jgi:hypothetical protein